MQFLTTQTATLIVAGVINLAFSVRMYLAQKDNKSKILYSFIGITVSFWLFMHIIFESSPIGQALLWGQILYFISTLIPLTFILFAISFPNLNVVFKKREIVGILAPFIFIASLIASPGILLQNVINTEDGSRVIQFGPGYVLFVIYFISFFAWGFIKLYKKYRTQNGTVKFQIAYIFWAAVIAFSLGGITNLLLPYLGYFQLFWLGPILTGIMIMFTSNSLMRNSLLNGRIIATELFTVLILVILITETLFINSSAPLWLKGVRFLLIGVFGLLIVRSSLNEVKVGQEVQLLADQFKKANIKLERLNETKSDFLSIASHQLKTPLSIIKGYISMALEGAFGPVNQDIRVNLRKVYISNERLIGLVEDLLNLSRIEDGKMTYDISPVDLRDIISSVIEEFKEQAVKKNLVLTWDPPKEQFMVSIDKGKIRNVIFNLVDNALKYTFDGSVTVSIEKKNSKALVAVVDTGVGISTEHLKKLFQKFTRVGTEGVGKGSEVTGFGLGLYIARMIIRDHHGKIWVESQGEEKGSQFYIELPLLATTTRNARVEKSVYTIGMAILPKKKRGRPRKETLDTITS